MQKFDNQWRNTGGHIGERPNLAPEGFGYRRRRRRENIEHPTSNAERRRKGKKGCEIVKNRTCKEPGAGLRFALFLGKTLKFVAISPRVGND